MHEYLFISICLLLNILAYLVLAQFSLNSPIIASMLFSISLRFFQVFSRLTLLPFFPRFFRFSFFRLFPQVKVNTVSN